MIAHQGGYSFDIVAKTKCWLAPTSNKESLPSWEVIHPRSIELLPWQEENDSSSEELLVLVSQGVESAHIFIVAQEVSLTNEASNILVEVWERENKSQAWDDFLLTFALLEQA